ncbi:MAG: GGDEF domain-containing protein [Clostridia bacterium]|nr:GGDEF domain-containing protein [Clostridia bacterium]
MEGVRTRKVDLVFILLILISIAALVNVSMLNSQYLSGTSEQAIATAEAYSLDTGEKFAGRFGYVKEKTAAIAATARAATAGNLNETLRSYLETDDKREINRLRYFNGDKEYDMDGNEVAEENEQVLSMRSQNAVATYGLIYGVGGTVPSVACYCPVENSNELDGLVVFYSQEVILSAKESLNKDKLDFTELSVICSGNRPELQIVSVLHDKSGTIDENTALLDFMETLSGDTIPSEQIKKAVGKTDSPVFPTEINNERYIVYVGKPSPKDTGLYVVNLYRESVIYSSGLALMETSIITMALLMAVIVLFTVYYIIAQRRINAKIEALDTVNPILHCPTLKKFERDAKELLNLHKTTTFAVVVSHLQHFAYLNETYGDAVSAAVLRKLRDVFKNAMTDGETFAHLDNGEFVMLLHYSAEENLENRLISLYGVAKKHYIGDEIPSDYDIKLLFGIYRVDRSSDTTVSKMVEKAIKVSDLPTRTDVNKVCTFYDENLRSDYMMKAEIENKMEAALKSGEFRLFYQPKYNLINDRIDGAEILVRWYNSETKNYRSPAAFLPVFEENGFISKLDRQIYFTACENIAKWIEEGRKIYPISVNISRVTAIQPDFLEYYTMVKKHFNIADGFITLEFTESFAYENYEYLTRVAKDLKKAGFLCSIDDFGTGYSTYNILKQLEMDEIKLDKFFLDAGAAEEKDSIISQSIIDLGKKLGLKTTQEGVETIEDLRRLRAMGCNVIQGYFFAKPMSSNDYKKFIDDFAEKNPVIAAEKEYAETHKNGAKA